jgi:aromatic-L-amino-acid decarboxylase
MRPPDRHWNSAEFRAHGRAVIDWIANYLDSVEQRPVLAPVQPGEIRAQLPSSAPPHGEPFESMLHDLEKIILPGVTHWQSPNFFAYFPSNASSPSILGELLSAGLGVQGMLWATSPACTELETHVLDWMVEMLGLPAKFRSDGAGGGVIQDTASSAALCALLAARERATGFQSRERGVREPLTAYASAHAHSSIEKAMMVAGLGREHLRLIDAPAARGFAMDAAALARAIDADQREGRIPFFIAATVGTTSTGAVDPLREIGSVVRDGAPQAWLHVDAAMSGTAAICPELRIIHDGVEAADSYAFNPHKWMFVNFDCDCFWVADRGALIRALSILPEYLRNAATESGAVIDYRDWQIPLGRRFRALKLWFVIRHYGVEGLQALIREHVELARAFEAWVASDDRFELAAPRVLNLVCFRVRGADERNQRVMDWLNRSGRMYLTHTKLDGRLALRMSIGQRMTRRRHVEAAWALIREAASQCP